MVAEPTWDVCTRDDRTRSFTTGIRNLPCQDLGADYFINRIRKSRQTRRLVGQLTELGYDVTLEARTDA
jgi:hypothetical protein